VCTPATAAMSTAVCDVCFRTKAANVVVQDVSGAGAVPVTNKPSHIPVGTHAPDECHASRL